MEAIKKLRCTDRSNQVAEICRRFLRCLNVTNSNKNNFFFFCIDERVVKVLICTRAPPGDLMTDLKVEMVWL